VGGLCAAVGATWPGLLEPARANRLRISGPIRREVAAVPPRNTLTLVVSLSDLPERQVRWLAVTQELS
jgi:hypothetical protein